jgi:hypothetical protein
VSALADEYLEISEAVDSLAAPGLQEAVVRHIAETRDLGAKRADGLIPLVVIRPGIGKGKGKHLYEARMLQEAVTQGRFTNWKMYVDHQSPEAKKKSGGLPRSMHDLGGFIKESWWDPSYSTPQDTANGHSAGGVLGLAKPTRFMRALIEDIPEAIGASISASATAVRPVSVGGQQVWLVEGIQPRGSVDWVTEAGAGGKVISLMESLEESWSDELEESELMASMTDDELREWLETERPDLVLSLAEADDGDTQLAALTTKYLSKFNGNKEMALLEARRVIAEAVSTDDEGDEDMTPQALAEALSTEEGQAAVAPIVEALFVKLVAPKLGELIEAAIEDERELMQAEANASAERKLQVRDLRDLAHKLIRESRLPEAFQVPLLKKYDLTEGRPTPALDVLDIREGAAVVKTAEEVLREAVAEDISESRELLASARPTTVRGQGDNKPAAKTDGDGKEIAEAKTSGSKITDSLLQESKFTEDDLATMWDGI